MIRPSTAGAWMAVVFGVVGAGDAQTPVKWSDGMAEYEAVSPAAAWCVPPRLMSEWARGPEWMIEKARAMSAEELGSYSGGTARLAWSEDFPLFAFDLEGTGVGLWTGKRTGPGQQISPRVWSGETWEPTGRGDGRADSIEFLFAAPGGKGRAYVLICQQGGERGQQAIRTERIRWGRFPGFETILRRGIETADTVVYLPQSLARLPEHGLDCMKGRITMSELRALLAEVSRPQLHAFLFLDGSSASKRVRFSFAYSIFQNDAGGLFLGRMDATSYRGEHVRWSLARPRPDGEAAPAAALRWTNRGRAGEEWIQTELSVGRKEPGQLYTKPLERSQTDGGSPLFDFRLRRSSTETAIVPRGRFGVDSLKAAEPDQLPDLGCEYRFIDCGPGVIKLEIRPTTRPWKAEIEASYREMIDPFGPLPAAVATSKLALDV